MAAISSPLGGKTLLMIVGGGVAAYKGLDLIRRLRERDVAVTAVLTAAAREFVTPLSLASLTGRKVYDDLFSLTDEAEMGHIQLSRASDFVLVAPATAHLIARAAQGLADDLASTLLLATDKRPVFAPAMNVRMWLNPATVRNVAQLRKDGAVFLGPADGEMACGEFGPGRLFEPLDIVAGLEALVTAGWESAIAPVALPASGRPLAGRKAVVTAGPTVEPIDPVRYISNHSSGKQGYALARALADLGAEVTLVSGPVALPAPAGVRLEKVQSAQDMLAASRAALPADIFVAAAAVADWRVKRIAQQKTKKGPGGPPRLELVENPDILATIAGMGGERPRLVVGFAAETENLIDNARAKLRRKGCDLIIANDVGGDPGIFGGEFNHVAIVEAEAVTEWPRAAKDEIARKAAALIAERLAR